MKSIFGFMPRATFSGMLAAVLTIGLAMPAQAQTPLNVSYDPTRELYQAFSAAFAKY